MKNHCDEQLFFSGITSSMAQADARSAIQKPEFTKGSWKS